MKFDTCLAFTLNEEGGFQSSPKDRGNWIGGVLAGTNRGISAPVLAVWLRAQGRPSAPIDVARAMKLLSLADARAIYLERYWTPIHGDGLPEGVDLMVFDHAVNAGVGASARLLQGVLPGVALDGAIGPQTLGAVCQAWASDLIPALHDAQQRAYEQAQDFALFGAEWLDRLRRRRARAEAIYADFRNRITGETA